MRGSVDADGYAMGAVTVWLVALGAVAVCAAVGWMAAFRARRRGMRSESMLARHREMSLDLICTASFDGHFVDVNPAWKDVFGYESDELTTQPFVDFIHPDDLERTVAEVEKQAA